MTYNSSWSEFQSSPQKLNIVVSEELRLPWKDGSVGTRFGGEPIRRMVSKLGLSTSGF